MKSSTRMTRALSLLLSMSLLVAPSFAQEEQEGPLALTLETYLVTTTTLKDGTVEEEFTAAETAFPGQVLEYRVLVENVSDEALPVGSVIITVPIPAATAYLSESATASLEDVRLEFSIDEGETFAEPPLVRTVTEDGVEREEIFDPEQYQVLRWVVLVPLEPGEELVFSYRVTVR